MRFRVLLEIFSYTTVSLFSQQRENHLSKPERLDVRPTCAYGMLLNTLIPR